MFSGSQFDGGAFSSSQASQSPDPGLSKNRGARGGIPLTVKQISEALDSSDDKSSLVVDGVDVTNVRLLGLVMSKKQRATDVNFSVDDGTGRIDITKWTNDAADSKEAAVIQNGMYVVVNGSLKGFHGKMTVNAFSIRPVVDYNEVALHFIKCIHVHLQNTGHKVGDLGELKSTSIMSTPVTNEVKEEYHTPVSKKAKSGSDEDIYKLVLDVFEEPTSNANEHGIHVDEVVRRLGIPMNKIKDAINYHVDVGHIYSTIDDYHFKSACIG